MNRRLLKRRARGGGGGGFDEERSVGPGCTGTGSMIRFNPPDNNQVQDLGGKGSR